MTGYLCSRLTPWHRGYELPSASWRASFRLCGQRLGDGADDAFGDIGGPADVVGVELLRGEVSVLGEAAIPSDVIGLVKGFRVDQIGEFLSCVLEDDPVRAPSPPRVRRPNAAMCPVIALRMAS